MSFNFVSSLKCFKLLTFIQFSMVYTLDLIVTMMFKTQVEPRAAGECMVSLSSFDFSFFVVDNNMEKVRAEMALFYARKREGYI